MCMNADNVRNLIVSKSNNRRPTLPALCSHVMFNHKIINLDQISLKRGSVDASLAKIDCVLIAAAWIAYDLESLWAVLVLE